MCLLEPASFRTRQPRISVLPAAGLRRSRVWTGRWSRDDDTKGTASAQRPASPFQQELENRRPRRFPSPVPSVPSPVPITVPTVLMAGFPTTHALLLYGVLGNALLLWNRGSSRWKARRPGLQETQVETWLSRAWGPLL